MGPDRLRVVASIRRHPWILGVSAAYVAGWTTYGFATASDSALPYLLWMLFAAGILLVANSRVHFSTPVLVVLATAGFFHLAGGFLVIDGATLYERSWGLVGFDHLVHVMGLGGAGLAVWEATCWKLRAISGPQAALVAFLAANAIGAIVEIGAYLATFVMPAAQVGDYANNMQDLIANLVGAGLAAWWASRGPRGLPRT